jgi:hypothetical protein
MKDARRWCCLAALVGLAATVAEQEKSASSTSQTDVLETARAAVERLLTARSHSMFRRVRVTADSAKGSSQITVIASLQSANPDSWPEDVADVYSLIWQALMKSEGFKLGEGFKAVDRIVVRATGLEGFAIDCPVKVVEESQGRMTLERMKGGCKPFVP